MFTEQMLQSLKDFGPSLQTAAKTIFATFKILHDEGGQLSGRETMKKIENICPFTDWEKELYEKTNNIRWQSILHFYTVDAQKAGYLRKNKGIWYLTEEGEKAINLGPAKLLINIRKAYKKWDEERKETNKIEKNNKKELQNNELEIDDDEQLQKANLDQLEELAIEGIKEFIKQKNPYEFQDLVAALLRAMNYYTPFIAPKGRDGGLDIVAYQDPLGAKSPRIKIQVKHRPDSSIAIDEIRSLIGLLNKDGDIGLFVTSGRFTRESERFARDSHIHVKLMDFENFISLWQDNYHKLNDEEKNMLPLHKIYFLGSND